MCVFFRLLYNKILTSMTVIIECISWLINVTDNNAARWIHEIERESEDSVYVYFVNSKLRYLVHICTPMALFYVKFRLTHCIC